MKSFKIYFNLLLLLALNMVMAQIPSPSGGVNAEKTERPPALLEIKESELKEDLFTLASDTMRGKRAGTLMNFGQRHGWRKKRRRPG